MKRSFLLLATLYCAFSYAQPRLATGANMPEEWIDKDTNHKIKRLTNNTRSNLSFYFHNNPFVGNKMVFYSTNKLKVVADKQETYNSSATDRQLYLLDVGTLQSERLTNHKYPMQGEIVAAKLNEVYYQVKDSVFSVNLSSKALRLIYVFPPNFYATVTSINATGTLLSGVQSSAGERALFLKNPAKTSYFNLIYEAKLPRTLFTINVKSGVLNKVHTDSAWLNHVQFSPTNPNLLMFCHEGPWHKVDRIWTIDVNSKRIQQIHKRSMPMEIAGHEWFSKDGKTVWFDLQQPRGSTFFVSGFNLSNNIEKKYSLQRNEWSVHYTSSQDDQLFAGDGGGPGAVAKAPDGKWIYLFTPNGDRFHSEKLVNMQHHQYRLEPNVHFSPDQKWIIFRANFEGLEQVYAVEINKAS